MSSFGIVHDHAPMNKVNSLESMQAVIAVTDLGVIPHGLLMWIRGMGHKIDLIVHGWTEEPLPFTPPMDLTPNEQYFEKVRAENMKENYAHSGQIDNREVVTIDFNVLVAIWEPLEPGPHKEAFAVNLRSIPLFEPYLKSKLLNRAMVASSKPSGPVIIRVRT